MPIKYCCISAKKHVMVLSAGTSQCAGTSQYSDRVSSDLGPGMVCGLLDASLLRTWCQAGVYGWDVHTSQQWVFHLATL